MRIAFFDAHAYEVSAFNRANRENIHKIEYIETRLTQKTALLAQGFDCVCAFVNDRVDRPTLEILAGLGVKLIALRSAGFNHVDLDAAIELKIPVVRVPEYSPQAVAEHTVALILALNRKIHRAYYRVREGNFALDGLVGFDLYKKTIGVVGTGRIGAAFCRIMLGFGCHVLGFDTNPDPTLVAIGVEYVPFDDLLQRADVVSLHVPLISATQHMLNAHTIAQCKDRVFIINTSRGGLIDTKALIDGLKSGKIGAAGLDVYEEEEGVFFNNLSDAILLDDQLARLLTFPNVLLTSHQGFLTNEALQNIAETTLQNITVFETQGVLLNGVGAAG